MARANFHVTFYHGTPKKCDNCDSRFRNYSAFNTHVQKGHVCDIPGIDIINKKLCKVAYRKNVHGTSIYQIYGLVWKDKKKQPTAITTGMTQSPNTKLVAQRIVNFSKRSLDWLQEAIDSDRIEIFDDEVDGCGGIKKALSEKLVPDYDNIVVHGL